MYSKIKNKFIIIYRLTYPASHVIDAVKKEYRRSDLILLCVKIYKGVVTWNFKIIAYRRARKRFVRSFTITSLYFDFIQRADIYDMYCIVAPTVCFLNVKTYIHHMLPMATKLCSPTQLQAVLETQFAKT